MFHHSYCSSIPTVVYNTQMCSHTKRYMDARNRNVGPMRVIHRVPDKFTIRSRQAHDTFTTKADCRWISFNFVCVTFTTCSRLVRDRLYVLVKNPWRSLISIKSVEQPCRESADKSQVTEGSRTSGIQPRIQMLTILNTLRHPVIVSWSDVSPVHQRMNYNIATPRWHSARRPGNAQNCLYSFVNLKIVYIPFWYCI
jgi:hypothetical protein